MVDVTVLGISIQDDGSSPVLLLHPAGTRRILSVGIAPLEAVAVSTVLHGVEPPDEERGRETGAETGGKTEQEARKKPGPDTGRSTQPGPPAVSFAPAPSPHEFLLNAVTALGAALAAVELVGCSDGVFSARAIFTHEGANVRVACRPADGVAMALRCGAPVRCAEALLSYAESIDAVMAALPEHVRTLAAAKLGEQGGRVAPEWLRVPLAVEEALAARARNGAASSHDELVSVARRMMEEDDERRRSGTRGDRRPPRILVEPGPDAPGRKNTELSVRGPQIRVTMVRHSVKGEAEVLDEFEAPADGIPREVLVGLGLNRKEAEVVSRAAEDERWATLLRLLAPATKVPM